MGAQPSFSVPRGAGEDRTPGRLMRGGSGDRRGSGCQTALPACFSAPNLSLQGPQGPLSSFLLMSSSTSVSLGNGAVVKMAPGWAVPVQEGKERRRPEGPQNVYCSKVASVCVLVCWYTYECGYV